MRKKGNFTFGNYYPVESPIHNLNGRSKITAIFLFLITVFFADNFYLFALLYAFAYGVIKLSRVPIKVIFRSVRMILWLAVLTGVLNAMFIQGEVLFELGFITITREGIELGLLMILRLIILIGFASILTLTTTPVELTDSLESMLKPFERFNLPTHELALMVSIALRFIPILMQEVDIITKSQRARGADFSKIRNIVALIVPLFASAINRANDLAIAMEARGYNGGEGRTKFHKQLWRTSDTVFIAVVAVFCVLIIALRFVF